MRKAIPRLLIAGASSGCGKTTVVCAILQALKNRGCDVAAFKCGPDYIDPMFHSRIIGAKSANLDLHFFSENTLRFLLAKNADKLKWRKEARNSALLCLAKGGGLTFFASGLNENGTEAADKRLRVHHGEVSIDNVDGFSLMRLGGR